MTHWGRVAHICVNNLTILGSDNGLLPGWCQAIIRNNDRMLLIRPLGTNFHEILSKIHTFSFKKMLLKMLSAKWRPSCLGLNVLKKLIWKCCQQSGGHFVLATVSLWASGAIWRQRYGSTLVQVMACCLMASSHYLNQCWLITIKVQWHSSGGNFAINISAINHWNKLEYYLSKILFKWPWDQWVNAVLFPTHCQPIIVAMLSSQSNEDGAGLTKHTQLYDSNLYTNNSVLWHKNFHKMMKSACT